ncbi:MAG: phytanoyl-CoA dioxygenase family protein [Nitrospira sp. CG24E]|nr:MAG: phytanoyl-CoA dioxygenase family protein [Nitrospira sp. CG24E]
MMITNNVRSRMASTARMTAGAVRFWMDGRTPGFAYQSMVGLFCMTGGTSNDTLSRLVSLLHPPYRLSDMYGVLGNLGAEDISRVILQLDQKGHYVFERRLPSDFCDRLLQFSLTNRCLQRGMSDVPEATETREVERYPRKNPGGVRYDFSARDVINNLDVQLLMADRSILAVAQSYLRCSPILDVMSMWWHTAYSKVPDKDAAQFWHFDMDRIKWLKFFIYLTDVGTANGPHSFVEGSHRTGGIPDSLRLKGYVRLTDEEVEACYPRERFIEFTAPRGTVIAEDTRGLHKGKLVQWGDRLVLQLQFSNSLFGGYYPPSKLTRVESPELQAMIRRCSRLYSNYWREVDGPR